MTDPIVLSDIDARGVATVTFNRPQVNNAYNGDMIAALVDALAAIGGEAEEGRASFLAKRKPSWYPGAAE